MIQLTCVGALRPFVMLMIPKGLDFIMTVAQIIVSIVYFIISLALIAIVILQSGKSAGLSGAIGGGAETFLSKNKAKSVDSKLAKFTKWVAIAFMVLTLVMCFLG